MDIPTLEELPTEFETTMWVGINRFSGELELYSYDMSDMGYAMLGQVELTVPVPQVDPRKKMVEGLRVQRNVIEQEYASKLKIIDEHLQELLALPSPTADGLHNEE